MSTTRKAPDNMPLSQERYMSSPEYAELRGLSGNAVAQKAAYLEHPRKKSLLFWLQAMSLRPGGLPKLAREFLQHFEDRIGTPTMLSNKVRGEQRYPAKLARQIDAEMFEEIQSIEDCDWDGSDKAERVKVIVERTHAQWLAECRPHCETVVAFLFELAINPKVQIRLPGEAQHDMNRERQALKDRHEIDESEFRSGDVPFFRDVVGALIEFQDWHAAKAREEFIHTNISREVFKTLDNALRRAATSRESDEQRIALLQGAAGVGKTEAVKAWCEQHMGEARMIRLVGVSHKTGFFRAIAKVLGLASSYGRTATEMQARVEAVLQSSRLMLIIDEAQYGFSSGDRIYSQPEIINWTYSALANYGVPVVLVATEQFGRKLRQAEEQVVWAGGPAFKRRLRPHVKLPAKPLAAEMFAIARKRMPGASEPAIKELVGYAGSTDYCLTNLVNAIRDAKEFAADAGRACITYDDARRAVRECREPSDAASKECFTQPQARRKSLNQSTHAATMHTPCSVPERGASSAASEEDLRDTEPLEKPRFAPAISGRPGRVLVTT